MNQKKGNKINEEFVNNNGGNERSENISTPTPNDKSDGSFKKVCKKLKLILLYYWTTYVKKLLMSVGYWVAMGILTLIFIIPSLIFTLLLYRLRFEERFLGGRHLFPFLRDQISYLVELKNIFMRERVYANIRRIKRRVYRFVFNKDLYFSIIIWSIFGVSLAFIISQIIFFLAFKFDIRFIPGYGPEIFNKITFSIYILFILSLVFCFGFIFFILNDGFKETIYPGIVWLEYTVIIVLSSFFLNFFFYFFIARIVVIFVFAASDVYKIINTDMVIYQIADYKLERSLPYDVLLEKANDILTERNFNMNNAKLNELIVQANGSFERLRGSIDLIEQRALKVKGLDLTDTIADVAYRRAWDGSYSYRSYITNAIRWTAYSVTAVGLTLPQVIYYLGLTEWVFKNFIFDEAQMFMGDFGKEYPYIPSPEASLNPYEIRVTRHNGEIDPRFVPTPNNYTYNPYRPFQWWLYDYGDYPPQTMAQLIHKAKRNGVSLMEFLIRIDGRGLNASSDVPQVIIGPPNTPTPTVRDFSEVTITEDISTNSTNVSGVVDSTVTPNVVDNNNNNNSISTNVNEAVSTTSNSTSRRRVRIPRPRTGPALPPPTQAELDEMIHGIDEAINARHARESALVASAATTTSSSSGSCSSSVSVSGSSNIDINKYIGRRVGVGGFLKSLQKAANTPTNVGDVVVSTTPISNPSATSTNAGDVVASTIPRSTTRRSFLDVCIQYPHIRITTFHNNIIIPRILYRKDINTYYMGPDLSPAEIFELREKSYERACSLYSEEAMRSIPNLKPATNVCLPVPAGKNIPYRFRELLPERPDIDHSRSRVYSDNLHDISYDERRPSWMLGDPANFDRSEHEHDNEAVNGSLFGFSGYHTRFKTWIYWGINLRNKVDPNYKPPSHD